MATLVLALASVPGLTIRTAAGLGPLVKLHPGLGTDAAVGLVTPGRVMSAFVLALTPVPRLAVGAAAGLGPVVEVHPLVLADAAVAVVVVFGVSAATALAMGGPVVPGCATGTATRIGPVVILHVGLGANAAALAMVETSITATVFVRAKSQVEGILAIWIRVWHSVDQAQSQRRGGEKVFQKHCEKQQRTRLTAVVGRLPVVTLQEVVALTRT
jgi:hypothetical protein